MAASVVALAGALHAEPASVVRRRPGTAGGADLVKLAAEVAAELRGLAAEVAQASWEPRLRRLVARHLEGELPDEALFAQLPLVRDKLRGAAGLATWHTEGRHGERLAARARYLVALAGDPRDDAALALVQKEHPHLRVAPAGLAGPSLDAALEKWRDDHFTREGVPDPRRRTDNHLIVLAQDEGRALVEHYVRYQHWAYSNTLVLRRQRGQWRVHLVIDGILQHFDRR